MTWRYLGLLCLLAFLASAAAADGPEEKSLLDIEHAWAKAIEKRDAKAIDGFLAEGFISIEADGSLLDKKQYIAARLKDPLQIETSDLSEVRVRIYGGAAAVSGHYRIAGKLDGKKVSYDYRYVDVYVKQGTAWKCISTQLTPLRGN